MQRGLAGDPGLDLILAPQPGRIDAGSDAEKAGPFGPESFEGDAEAARQLPIDHDPWELGLAVVIPDASMFDRAWAYDVDDHPEVRRHLESLIGARRSSVEQWLDRSGRYLEMIQEVLRDHGLPEDLFATVIVESGVNPAAVSQAGAMGLWQFMADTARHYGLRVDRWVDERLDPEKSTRAAARYLRDLHAMFGSWPLVHAAYNTGEGRVARAIRSLRTTDFWEIARAAVLSEETRRFVAVVQAVILIVREPERYGFSLTPESPWVRHRTIEVPPGTSLARLASGAGVAVEVLRQLNPELRLGKTPPDGVHQLKVPADFFPPSITRRRGASAPPVPRLRPAPLTPHPGVQEVAGPGEFRPAVAP